MYAYNESSNIHVTAYSATGCVTNGVQTAVACEGRDTLTISCPAGQVINVIDGFYGRAVPDTELCPYGAAQNDDTTCRSASSSTLVRFSPRMS